MLLDTGSDSCLFKTDDLEAIGFRNKLEDETESVVGIGGIERVVQTRIDKLEVGELSLSPFSIQLGKVDYGFGINGILGCDFLLQTRVVVDFDSRELYQKTP